jgi:hypothetical protein
LPTLPNVTSRFTLDVSDLTKAERVSAKTHAAFQEHAKTSTTHNLRFTESLTTMMSHFGGLPPIASQAGRSLESMASTGVTGMGLLGGAALAAVGAVAEVVGQSIKSYTELGDKVENFKRVVGSSAEESSRMVETFQALNVSEETATQGMFKLSKAIETAPKKLADLGIEVQRDAKGNVDLSATLLNVADAYNHTGDQAKKNLILFDAFGKSGKDMIPILEQGSVALKNLEASAHMIFTQADLDRLRDLKIKNAEIKQSWDAMWQSIGQNLIPAQDALATAYLRSEDAQRKVSQAEYESTLTGQNLLNAQRKIVLESNASYDAAQKVKASLDLQTQATKDAAAADEALWAAADKVITQIEAQASAGFALKQAQVAVSESQARINQAQEAYDAAVKKSGASSDEAVLAAGSLTTAVDAQLQSYERVGSAARKLQHDQDLAAGSSIDAAHAAALEAKAELDALQAEADGLAPGSPLRKNLEGYIDLIKTQIPSDVITRVHLIEVSTGSHGGGHGLLQPFAEGGRPPVGVPFTVGEHGIETMVIDRPATVYPHGQSAPAGGGSAGAADMSSVEALLRETNALLRDLAAEPSGQTGVEAALYKAVAGAGLNRLRGMAGA